MNRINHVLLAIAFPFFMAADVYAEDRVDAFELVYEEREAGTEAYQVKFTVTDRYLRIDQLGDESGYVVYDDKLRVVRSVTHADQSTLLIPDYAYQKPDFSKRIDVEYFSVPEAPAIAGKPIYGYRAVTTDESKETCMDIKLAEGLLPEVTTLLASYQKVMAGQQSRLLEATPEEFRGRCFLSDQIFNEGDYYSKGLPIYEWHSNGKSRLLLTYKKIVVDAAIFKSEEKYQEYSLE
ncbi:MAG: hypothetical protein PF589_10065 [Gammaproteobacteria bacterium]|jgi:hypothetical protein|nr:hypothetical protein [Gammaproteobacteria bacterium]